MRYEVTTRLTPREVLEDAMVYFGPGGAGLHLSTRTPDGLVFQGGGGYVTLTVKPGTSTTLELETREWDYAVQQFMARLGRPRWWARWRRRKAPAMPPSSSMFPILVTPPDQGPKP